MDDRKETEAEFRQRMWDTYIKPLWRDAHEADRPVRPDWPFLAAFVAALAVIGVGVVCLLKLTE